MAPSCQVSAGDDLEDCWNRLKPELALYVGGMGAKGKNFYNDLACRYGYEREAAAIQSLYLAGKKREAAGAVPNELVDEVSLCGTPERIRDRLSLWKQAGVGTLIVSVSQPSEIRMMAEIFERL